MRMSSRHVGLIQVNLAMMLNQTSYPSEFERGSIPGWLAAECLFVSESVGVELLAAMTAHASQRHHQ